MVCSIFIKNTIRSHLHQAAKEYKIASEQVQVFAGNVLLESSALMSEIYEKHKSDNGFLYLKLFVDATAEKKPGKPKEGVDEAAATAAAAWKGSEEMAATAAARV